jgi:hypothetical protein
LNVGLGKLEARRAAIHHHAHTATVGFTPGRDAKKMTERVRHWTRVRENLRGVNFGRSVSVGAPIALYLRFEGLF